VGGGWRSARLTAMSSIRTPTIAHSAAACALEVSAKTIPASVIWIPSRARTTANTDGQPVTNSPPSTEMMLPLIQSESVALSVTIASATS
jgi:hypothetical protein